MPGLDLDKLKDKKARRQTSGWTPKEGSNLIRILPHTPAYFTEQVGDFAFEFRSHYCKAEGTDTQVYRCLKDKKEPCPFCSAVQRNRESTNPKIKKAAEETRASTRHLMNIVDLNDLPQGIQAFECGPMVYNGVLDFMANPAWGDLINPKEGRNITLQLTPGAKSSSGFNSYAVMPYPQQTDVTPHLPADWIEKLENLESSVPQYATAPEILRWLNILGLAEPSGPAGVTPPVAPAPQAPSGVLPSTVPAAAAVAPPPAVVSAPIPIPNSGQVVVPAKPAALSTLAAADPVSIFAAANGRGVKASAGGKTVPDCYSTGPGTGFNPAVYPCEKGCPVRADCQLISLGLG